MPGSPHDVAASLWPTLAGRAAADPFLPVASGIFLLAIVHTFLAAKITSLSHRLTPGPGRAALHLLGEVEIIFGLWVVPLVLAFVAFRGWHAMVRYLAGVSYAEPIFVLVIMAIAGTRPVLHLAERGLALVAALGGGSPAAWWLSILTVGPLLGSFITEPAAMTICALLLLDRFYRCNPPMPLRYATLGLLFVNISVGGTLTHFAAPPVVMVASAWDWGFTHLFANFGWKAAVGIFSANALYFAAFRKQLLALAAADDAPRAEPPISPFVTAVHLAAIAWTVLYAHHVALVLLGLLFFLAFAAATGRAANLRPPLLVGGFLAALVIHGGLQGWWIAPVLGGLSEWPLMLGATVLTAFNDNAAITYLATLVPGFTDSLKHAVVAGAVTGGGLTVIANAPNPAGQSLLQAQFDEDGVHPLGLFLAALAPTIIVGAALMLLPG